MQVALHEHMHVASRGSGCFLRGSSSEVHGTPWHLLSLRRVHEGNQLPEALATLVFASTCTCAQGHPVPHGMGA